MSDNLSFKDVLRKADSKGKVALILSSWFGAGLIPWAPGTFGSLAALPIVALSTYLGPVFHGTFLIFLIPLAVLSAHLSSIILNKKDPSEIVIDEVAGLMLTLFLLPLSWTSMLTGFMFFRVFDIIKPFPAGWFDKNISGGLGIVLDDLIAGIYANICVRLLLLLLKSTIGGYP